MAARKRKLVGLPILGSPPSHLEALRAQGFEALSYQNVSILTRCSDGSNRHEWLPRDCVNWERRLFVRWATDDAYDFPGWEPQNGHTFGGRYKTIAAALAWFNWFDRQRSA